MTEQGFPNSHTTVTTTTTVTTNTTSDKIALDWTYLKTKDGIIKILEILFDFLGFLCMVTSIYTYQSRGSWFTTVTMIGFWYTLIILVFNLFHITDKLRRIPWPKIEFVFCVVIAFFYLIAASLCANYAQIEVFAASAFFGFAAMVIYGVDAFFQFLIIRSN